MLVSPVCTGECQNTIFLASGAGIDSALPQIDRHRAWDSLGRGSKARTPRAGARQVGNTPRAAHLCQWWGHGMTYLAAAFAAERPNRPQSRRGVQD